MPMKLKTVEVEIDGKKVAVALVQDGKPLYEDDKGADVPFDADQAVSRISALNREAQTHREAKEAAETKLKTFEGIEDPAAALDALAKVANLSSGELKTAREVEDLKAAIERTMKANYDNQILALQNENKTLTTDRDTLKTSLDNEVIGGAFARSKFIAEKTILPTDAVESMFRRHFSLEEGKIVGKDANGGPLVSSDPNRVGQPATFEEAIEQLIANYPNKAMILKGTGNSGSGALGGAGGNPLNKTMTRAEFDRLPPDQQHAKIKDGWKPVDG